MSQFKIINHKVFIYRHVVDENSIHNHQVVIDNQPQSVHLNTLLMMIAFIIMCSLITTKCSLKHVVDDDSIHNHVFIDNHKVFIETHC